MKDYCENRFEEYYHHTFYIDPFIIAVSLAKRLPETACILDVGCGSGRDLLWFKGRGFEVVGFERSRALTALAVQNVGCQVIVGDFEVYHFSTMCVGAVALVEGLVHVPHQKMKSMLAQITQARGAEAYALIALKEGKGTQFAPDRRVFYLWKDEDLRGIFNEFRFTIATGLLTKGCR